MTNIATINGRQLVLSPLEAIRVIATRFGFDDVDAEPTDATGKWTVKAHGAGKSMSVSGKSLDDCCQAFCSRLGLT